jgi:hypothetical protein
MIMKEFFIERLEKRYARMNPKSPHARILRKKLDKIGSSPVAEAPVVEVVVEEEVVEPAPKKKVTRKKKED